jgi:hypothetical protein
VSGFALIAAVAVHSRIGLLLAAVGMAAAAATRAACRPTVPWAAIDLTAAFNAVLTAMAVGGVWFVPQPPSILLAALAAAVTTVFVYALSPAAAQVSLPLLSLPFVLTTHVVLLASRVREHDRWPASAPLADRPEDALARHLMRTRRFGDVAWLPFRLPFRGTWLVTQAHDGADTHKGWWRHAFDFESCGSDGRTYEQSGRDVRDYHCYGLPVLAAGTGIVDQVVDGVADNAVGQINAHENWGNAVVLAHGSGLYSVCAHLQSQSIRVKPGDSIRAGAEIGRVGNSGRSAVPHLHFHVQRGAALGSPTIAADFGDVVTRVDGTAAVANRVIPVKGDLLRPVVRDEAIAAVLACPPGSSWCLTDVASGRTERARVDVDLLGRRMLASRTARLFVDPYDTGFVVVAMEGRRDSLLSAVLLALARVPFDHEATLAWKDRVPRRLVRGWPSFVVDLVTVLAPRLADFEMAYTSRRTERAVIVEGRGPGVTTRAVLSIDREPHRLEIQREGRPMVVELQTLPVGSEEAAA